MTRIDRIDPAGAVDVAQAAAPAGRARTAFIRHLPLVQQFVGFGLVGLFLTVVNVVIYWVGTQRLHVAPNLAWSAGFVVALAIGYVLQSRFVFKPGEGVSRAAASARYVAVALLGFALNSLWVWLLVTYAQLAPWTPIPPVVFVTPVVTFLLNRLWVFR